MMNFPSSSDWRRDAQELRSLLKDPSKLGLKRKQDVLSHLAARRGKQPSALRSIMTALSALEAMDPAAVADPSFKAGPGHILQLRRLQSLDPKTAETIRRQVFRGEVTVPELRKLQASAQPSGSRGRPPASSRAKTVSFFRYAAPRVPALAIDLFDFRRPMLQTPAPEDLVQSDLIVVDTDGRRLAVEAKSGATLVPRRRMIEMYATVVLFRQNSDGVLIVVTKEWWQANDQSVKCFDEKPVQGVAIVTLNQDYGSYQVVRYYADNLR